MGEERLELVLLPTDTEPVVTQPYELSESMPELIKFVVEIVFRPPGVNENFVPDPREGAEM